MRPVFILFLICSLVSSTGCDKVAEALGSYPGLTLYFERASNGHPFEDVTAKVVDFSSAAVSGADGKVTLRVPAQAEEAQVHLTWTSLVPYEERTKDLWFRLGKGDNYYHVVLQDDPRQPYKLAASAIQQDDGTYIDGTMFVVSANVTGTIVVPAGVKKIIIL